MLAQLGTLPGESTFIQDELWCEWLKVNLFHWDSCSNLKMVIVLAGVACLSSHRTVSGFGVL